MLKADRPPSGGLSACGSVAARCHPFPTVCARILRLPLQTADSMLLSRTRFTARVAAEVEVDLKVIDCSREHAKTPAPESAQEQSANPNDNAEASARDRDSSTFAIVAQSALVAAAFYLVANLFYLYVYQWSDLDVDVIALPSFDELDRSVSAQRAQWSSIPVIVDSPWRRVYGAASFSDAIGIVEQANACSTPDAQAFLLRSRRVCEYLAPNFSKDPRDKNDQDSQGDSQPASWSILLTMYFQDRYCVGYELGAEQRCRNVGGPVSEAFASGEDEACLAAANRNRGVRTSFDGSTRSELLYLEIADRTTSPELYLESLQQVDNYDRAGVLEANEFVDLMGFDEIDAAKRAASMIAMCDIYGVCPPLGLIAMSECIPHRCPVDGDLETYLRRVNSVEVSELFDRWSAELVSRRGSLVRGGPRSN